MNPFHFFTSRTLMRERGRDLEAQRDDLKREVQYWRTRYEKLADEVLFRQGAIASPVHVEPATAPVPLGERVMRVASLVGRDRPASPGHAIKPLFGPDAPDY